MSSILSSSNLCEIITCKANEYLSWDPNPHTQAILLRLLSEIQNKKNNELLDHKLKELYRLLNTRLAFGTAGLRGPMGLGYCCMNELVILQTCQGLCVYLESQLGSSCKEQGVVIGYDHRMHPSDAITSLSIARISASVLLYKGFKVYLLENYVPTPFVAFGVTLLKAAAGIMVTASHNPKDDNGFKLYWSNGCQIIPPHDSGISQCIDSNLQPWTKYDISGVIHHSHAIDKTNEVADAYYKSMKLFSFTPSASSPLVVTYTAMHGVGTKWICRAFEEYGHPPPLLVKSQCEPDPSFPTVRFPNPEEKGALNLAISTATEASSRLIIANDPDADRLALAELNTSTNGWHIFTGNEIGVLLGKYQISRWKLKRSLGMQTNENAAVLASVVSSRMLRAIAIAEGITYCDTLTGFKWIGNKAVELKYGTNHSSPHDVLFSYEEALGYCVGDILADKDGISSALIVVELAHSIYNHQLPNISSVYDYLQSIYKQYGQFCSYNSYYFSYQQEVTDRIFYKLRHKDSSVESINYGKSYVGVDIVSVKDVTLGYDSTAVDNVSDLPKTPESHMIMFEFTNGCSITLRTSGTEPKIKYYTEICGKYGENLKPSLVEFVDKVIEEMLEPSINSITKP